ncbi:MAG: GAF domain-containing protein [Anaerolineae bacterium]|nr:GAF domain-containing protein [Anaerolineae bacterium]
MNSDHTIFLQSELSRLRAENDTLRNDLFRLRSFVEALTDLSAAEVKFKDHADLLRLLDNILRNTLDLLSAPDGSLMLLDTDTGELEFVIVHGDARDSLVGQRLQPREGVAGWVAATGQPVLIGDVRTDPRFSERVDEMVDFHTKSIAAAPLVGNGRVLGVVEALNQPEDAPFVDMDRALLTLLCRFAGEALADIEAATSAAEETSAPEAG